MSSPKVFRREASRRRVLAAIAASLAVALCLAAAACSAVLGLDPPDETPDASGGGYLDAPLRGDAPLTTVDGSPAACTPYDGGPDAATYYAMNGSGGLWNTFDTAVLTTAAGDYAGGAFDGRYVYFAPNNSGLILRYDPNGTFGQRSSWTSFDTTTLNPLAAKYAGAVFDGHFVYFVPQQGVVVRLDPSQSFTTAAAWSTFNFVGVPGYDAPGAADAGAFRGFSGAEFDGRYIYFVPNNNGANDGLVARYDTLGAAPANGDAGDASGGDATDAGDAGDAGSGSLSDLSRWAAYGVNNVNAAAIGFSGGTFDGRYVYLAPFNNGTSNATGGYSGYIARYDTTTDAAFIHSSSAWSTFDMASLSPPAYGFRGATFDGRYVYLVPNTTTAVLRFDSQSPTLKSWTQFDLSATLKLDAGQNAQFVGAVFDGRFVYFIPEQLGPSASVFPFLVRYDTSNDFTQSCAWSAFNVGQENGSGPIGRFYGAVFDGQYIYLAARETVIARFKTKSDATFPDVPAAGASTY